MLTSTGKFPSREPQPIISACNWSHIRYLTQATMSFGGVGTCVNWGTFRIERSDGHQVLRKRRIRALSRRHPLPKQPITNPTTKTFEQIAANGPFLNQDLITKRLAVRVKL